MDIQKRELWDRLENEPERAYRAFESFLSLPSNERTLLAAYRQHVGNPDAAKPSDTWSRWSNDFAWRERAAAYDDHLASLRREAYKRVIEEQAAQQAREVERTRYHFHELASNAYLAAMEWFEDTEWAKSNLRSSNVVNIMRLHLEATDKLIPDAASQVAAEAGDWDEKELEKAEGTADAEADRILADLAALRERRLAEGDDPRPEEDLL